jgi:hypothetical protein
MIMGHAIHEAALLGADYLYSLDSVRSYPMRTFRPLLIATALLAGCEQSGSLVGPAANQPSLAKTAVHVTEMIPIEDGASEVSFCTGEDIAFVGTLTTSTNIVSEPGFDDHSSVQEVVVATGTGLITGTKWLVRIQNHFSFNTPSLVAPNGTSTTTQHVDLVSPDGLPNLLLSFDQVIVYTSQGVKTTVENFTVKCRG